MNINRREFLRTIGVAPVGFAATAAQDEPSRPRVTRRMAFEEPAKLSDDYVRRVVLLTDRMPDEQPDMPALRECSFSNWPPDELLVWEGLVIEWQNEGFGEILTGNAQVRAERMAELRIVVDEQEEPVELGTPFIVNNRIECPEGYVGVTASEVPGLRITTPPDLDVEG